METNIQYQKYITDTKNLKTPQGRLKYQAPYTKDFEKIYTRAMEKDVKLSSAKNFIEHLSKGELGVIQKYNGLADAIDKGSLSPEAAYNLLVHDNEQYDFNGDGITKVGAASMMSAVPATMPSDVRTAYIEALNTLDGIDRLMATTLTFDIGHITSQINNTPYTPATIDYAYLSNQVESRLNPTGGAITSESTMKATRAFWEAFQSAYDGKRTTTQIEERDPAVEKFLEDLRHKGAIAFLAEMDQKKIEDKIKEFKDKLIKEMGNSPKAMAKIDKMVNDFTKQLLEELQNGLDNKKDSSKLDTQAMVKILIDMKKDVNTPLEKLLHVEA